MTAPRLKPGPGDPALAREIADVLRRGGIVGMRTDTVYGLLASVNRPDALRKLKDLKRREPGKPFLLLADGWIVVRSLTSHLTPVARRLGSRYWPGPLTMVLPGDDSLPEEVKGSGPTVAVRVPNEPLLLHVLGELRCAVAAPSANLPGKDAVTSAAELAELFGDGVDLVVDGGLVEKGISSTIVNCTGSSSEVLRQGVIVPSAEELL